MQKLGNEGHVGTVQKCWHSFSMWTVYYTSDKGNVTPMHGITYILAHLTVKSCGKIAVQFSNFGTTCNC